MPGPENMKLIFFFTFLLILVATAVVTLGGVIGVFTVPTNILALLATGLIVEVSAACVALFRQTDFFESGAKKALPPRDGEGAQGVEPGTEPPLLGPPSKLPGIPEEFGLITIHEGRGAKIHAEYDERLQHLKSHLDVMGFGLRSFREDHAKHFDGWSQTATLRILLLDPEAPGPPPGYAAIRDEEEENPEGQIEIDVRAFIRASAPLLDRERFHVRLYRCLPSINVFRVDDVVFWGPYLMEQQSRNTPTFVAGGDGILFREVTGHFERIWSGDYSRPIPVDWLEE